MDEITGFRGLAGEVVRSFVKPGVFFTIIPVVFFWLVCGLVYVFIGRYLFFPIDILLAIAASSLLIGRFALASSRGEIMSGFFNDVPFSESLAFAGRYCIYTVLWMIPVVLISWLMFSNSSGLMMLNASSLSGPAIVQAGFHGFVLLLLTVFSILMPTISCILSTYTETYNEVFTTQPISWLYHERLDDLIPFFAGIIGGVFVFWLVYIIPFILVAMIAFKISMGFGMTVSGFIYALPFLSSPIIIGRMSGAFVMGDYVISDEDLAPAEAMSPQMNVAPSLGAAGVSAATVQQQEQETHFDVNAVREHITQLSAEQMQKELPSIEIKRSAHPDNPSNLLSLAYMYQRLDRKTDAAKVVMQSLRYTMTHNLHPATAIIFKDFSRIKSNISLAPEELALLSDILVKAKNYLDAVWCVHQLLKAQPDDLPLQKKVIAIADAAKRGGQAKQAFSIYAHFMKNFPQSTLLEYAKEAVQELNRQLKGDS